MNEAETQGEEPVEPSAAEVQTEQELTVPKHRLDAVIAERNRLKEEAEMKERALQMLMQQRNPQQPPQEEDVESELEQLGLSKEATRKIKGMFQKELQKAGQFFGQHLGTLSMGIDETRFLQKNGADKEVYLEKIQNLRRAHAARGSQITIEDAYRLIRFEELESKAQKELGGKSKTPKTETKMVPEAKVTPKVEPKISVGAGKSIADLESELDEQIKAGSLRI